MIDAQQCNVERAFSTGIDSQIPATPQHDAIRLVLSRPKPPQVLVDIALILSGSEGAAIALAEPGKMVCRAGSGTLACYVESEIDVRGGLLGLCFRTAGVLSSKNVSMDERVDRAAASQLDAKSAIALPLCRDGAVLGVLEAVSSKLNAFDHRAIRNLEGVAELIAHAISVDTPATPILEVASPAIKTEATVGPLPLNSPVAEGNPSDPACNHAELRPRRARFPNIQLVTAISLLLLASGALFLRPWQKSGFPSISAMQLRSGTPPATKSRPTETSKLAASEAAQTSYSFLSTENSDLVQVLGIQSSSRENFTEITVKLNAVVHYDAHHFRNPERIYFDLHSSRLAPALGPWGRTFTIGDKFLLDVRVAQHAVGLTRVVLDTKGVLHWSAIPDANPPRLVIRVGAHRQDVEKGLAAVGLPQISRVPSELGSGVGGPESMLEGGKIGVHWRNPLPTQEIANSVQRKRGLRAIYLTGATAASPRGLDLIHEWRRLGGNAIVFDIKSNTGFVDIPFAHPLNNHSPLPPIDNLSRFVAYLHSLGIYAIGRIAVFRDDRLVTQHPELAVRSRRNGKPWKEKGKIVWADPSNPTVQQYNINLAQAAAAAGLDEVQFDYIRFPVEGNQKDAVFAIQSETARWRRSDVITHFVAAAYSQLHPMRVRLSLDVFGVLAWDHRADVASTGQDIRALMPYCDVISPMIYPSHFFGMDGYVYPGDAPQHFITEAMKRFSKIVANTGVLLRPWLQGFSWHTSTYSTDYVLTQIRTARANGARGFLFWNAENEYREPLAALAEMRSSETSHKSK